MALTSAAQPPPARRHLAVLAWALWTLTLLGFALFAWFDLLLRRAGRPDLALLTSSDTAPYLLGTMSAATVGVILANRWPRHPVGWLLLALGASIGASAVVTPYANYGLLARPGALPGAGYAAVYFQVGVLIWAAWLGFVLLLTPTGTLPSPRWRWWARAVVAAAVLAVVSSALLPFDPPFQAAPNPLAVPALVVPLRVVNGVNSLVTGLAVLVAAGSLVVRFRRARGVERQQLRWLALAAALTAMIVLGLGQLFGRDSSLVVAGATLAVAALFQPARRRVQEAVDRRFNRRRYDATQTIQASSARLRDEVDLDMLSAELVAVVEQTMQPAQVWLWLRPHPPTATAGAAVTQQRT